MCQYMFSNFFPIILPWDWKIWIKNQLIYAIMSDNLNHDKKAVYANN